MLTALELHEQARAANNAWRFRLARRLLLKARERANDAPTRAIVEGTLGFVEAELGDRRAGLALIDNALSVRDALPAFEVGKLLAQRALIRTRLGQARQALGDYNQAIPLLADRADELGRARLNRGSLHLQLGSMMEAIADFEVASAALDDAGLSVSAAKARHNLGYAAMMTGQLARALQVMDAEAALLRPVSVESAAVSDQDRGEALLAAGMHDEGRRNLRQAAELFGRKRWRRAQAEAELALARTWVVDDPTLAARLARRAGRRFVQTGAPARTLQCEAVEMASNIERGRGSSKQTAHLASRLARQGLRRDSTWMRVYAAQAALAEDGTPVRLRVPRSAGLSTRLLAHEVRARARRRPGDALRVLRAGLDELHQWQATFGSLDLQTATVSHGERLAQRGLELAVQSGQPALVYEWVEWLDAVSTRIVPLRPPADPEAAADLTELRVLAQRRPEPGTPDAERQVELLDRVRRRAWTDRGSASVQPIVGLDRLQAELAATAATLLALLAVGHTAWALVITPTRAGLVELGPTEGIRAALSGLAADLDMAAADLPPVIAASVRDSLRDRLAHLDDLVLAPLANQLRGERVVINPTGLFSGIAWTLLPSLRGRAVTIPRSASEWVSQSTRVHEYATAGFVAGPRLARAADEVAAASRHWTGATTLTGTEASAASVSELAGRVDLLHLAAHGHHVAENPLFSNLELVDGPWFGYDLDQLPQIPETVILSACELGATTIRRGDELLGLTTAWLHAGARCVIASPASVSDEVAAAILPDMHAQLAKGLPPADALAAATAAHPDLLSTFQCYGAGW
ncbi:MAG TPA: CHAT domain-containing protein [Micropruina sp.]|nr:CHAT domain-containing protein [Micropruina sp.]HMR20692.1 CHAT domain-containing protein [Micropruina sp.]